MKFWVTLLLPLVAVFITETATEPPVRDQDLTNWKEQVRLDAQRAAAATGWGWKNSQIKQTEGWGSDVPEEEEKESAQPPPQDPPVTTTVIPILLPDEPEDENEPPVIITEGPVTTTKGKGWQSNDNGHDTLMIYGGDAEKEKAVDWGNEGYKQLRMAETWESRRMESAQVPTEGNPAEIENEAKGKGKESSNAGTKGGWKGKGSNGEAAAASSAKKGKKGGSKASAQYKPDNYGLHSGVQPVYVQDW